MFRLILVIKELKYHSANKTVITIHNYHNLLIVTVVCGCLVYIFQCLLILLVLDEFDLILLDFVLLEVLYDFLGRPVF
jgi:hypothetical protein